MVATDIKFDKAFQALTEYTPLRWQLRLFDRLRIDPEIRDIPSIPRVCDLPTGLGKTSVIPIWIIALAQQAADGDHITLPRRLVYIVNRRTVVDQATTVVERIRKRLLEPSNSDWSKHEELLLSIASSLQQLSPDNLPLAVSTLRGELADNNEWRADPARAAIVIGTIDMIGSKLLFSGYGDGLYYRPHHAGVIGQDVLIVHDEAHLTPAFSSLLRDVKSAQEKDREPRPIQLMELSATQRGSSSDDSDVLRLEEEDEQDEFAIDRLDAKKQLHLHKLEPKNRETNLQTRKRFVQRIVELAHQHEADAKKVLIYVRRPQTAQEVVKALEKKLSNNNHGRIALLTGTIRGYERDLLVTNDQVYKELLDPKSCPSKTVYLVSTSAGEVGIDLDADHMVSDLTTLDSMIQRLGRVNRRGGEDRKARLDVVWTEKDEKPSDKATNIDKANSNTITILKRWDYSSCGTINASPRNLRRIVNKLSEDERIGSFSPMPEVQPLTDILLDAWSLTSIGKMPGRPAVAAYLHGLTNDPPETYVVWRQEVALFDKYEMDDRSLRRWFNIFGIHAGERLRGRTDHLKKELHNLLKEHRKKETKRDFTVVLLDEHGEAKRSRLSKVADSNLSHLSYKTVVLPVEAGGLQRGGMIDPKMVEQAPMIDVAEEVAIGEMQIQRQRWLCTGTKEASRYRHLLSEETLESLPPGLQERERVMLGEPDESAEDSEERFDLLLCIPEKQPTVADPETARVTQTLTKHTEAIKEHMGDISDRLDLEPSFKAALASAAKWHDCGKDRAVWQRYACNDNGTEPLAKSTKYLHWRALGGYRHEFGSLLEAMGCDDLRNHPERDLILHLIAAHHGRARPHFDSKAFDHHGQFTTRNNEDSVAEVMRRFGQLQNRFGRWGLAWLESLLRCADIVTSQPPTELTNAEQSQEIER